MSARASVTPSAEREWWLRALMVLQAPSSVFAAMRDDSDEKAAARQEPVLALVLLAGVATILAWSPTTPTLLDDPRVDGLLAAVFVFLAGAMYGAAMYWLGGAAIYLGSRGAGSPGSYRRARHTVAYAAAPLALSLFVVWPLRVAVVGSDAFRKGGSDDGGAARWLFEALDLAFLAWAVALLVLGIRTVQRWSYPRALGAVALAAFVVLGFTLVLLIPLSSG